MGNFLPLFLFIFVFSKQFTIFVDVEGTKDVKRMITLLAITGQFIPQNGRGSERLRKQMLINTHKVNRCERHL